MKQLPNKKILDELLNLAKDLEQQALSLCKLTIEIDEKWRIRLESKGEVAMQKSDGESS